MSDLELAERRRRFLRSLRRECEGLTATTMPARADVLAELIDVAELAADAIHIVHTGFREDIDFTALSEALERLGLIDPETGEKISGDG